MYVLVRADLSAPAQVVQACHAAHLAGRSYEVDANTCNMVVCSVADQAALLAAAQHLEHAGVGLRLFFEPAGGVGFSALASEPVHAPRQRRLFARYPLLWAQEETVVPRAGALASA